MRENTQHGFIRSSYNRGLAIYYVLENPNRYDPNAFDAYIILAENIPCLGIDAE